MARDGGDDHEVKMQQQEVSCWDYCILKMKRKKSSRGGAASHHVHDNNRQRTTSVGWSDVVKDAFTRSKRHFKSSSIGGGSRGGGFRYDAISYSQNFDDGGGLDDEEASFRGFSSRYAAPASHYSSSSSSRE